MHLELTPAQIEYRATVEQFARDEVAPRAAAIDESGSFPLDVIRAAAKRGLLGVTIPKTWGGLGRDYVSYALAIEAIARASATVAVVLSVSNSLVAELIAHVGRAKQRDTWLRRLAAGDAVGAFALSEPDAGTDAANQQTVARLDDHGYVLTGPDVAAADGWTSSRDPYLLETSVPGIFACGDVRCSPVKRVAAAVGEGSMAIAFVHQYLKQAEASPVG